MRIFYVADIHVHPDHLRRTIDETVRRDAQVLIIGGDIVPHHLPQAPGMGILDAQAKYIEGTLIPALEQLKAKQNVQIFLDFGNDDFMANRHLLERRQGRLLQLVHFRIQPLTPEVDLVGYMMVPPTPFQRKDWERPDTSDSPYPPGSRVRLDGYLTGNGVIEETLLDPDDHRTIEKDLARLSGRIERPFIFVSHCPPFDTPLDMLSNGAHIGSIAIRRFIETWGRRNQLLASLHGHIHESPRVSKKSHTRINNVLSINPGQERELQYVLLDLSDGPGAQGIRLI